MTTMYSIVDVFRSAMAAAGLTPPAEILGDGNIHRFATNGKRDDDAGWYVLYPDSPPAGAFGDWRIGVNETRHANGGASSEAERVRLKTKINALRRQRESEEQTRRGDAATRARALWKGGTPATNDHPYLQRKKIGAHGLRVTADGALMVPVCCGDGTIMSLQFIALDGGKKFLAGGATGGGHFVLSIPNTTGPLCIAEGFATAASIHEAKGYPTVVAFSASNLEPVAKIWRAKYPDRVIIICADDDHKTNGNPGMARATEAARAIGGLLAVPDFGADRPDGATDFNDLAQGQGLDAVRVAIERAQSYEESPMATVTEEESTQEASSDSWPQLDALALRGVIGDLVQAIEPHTEADVPALLVQALIII